MTSDAIYADLTSWKCLLEYCEFKALSQSSLIILEYLMLEGRVMEMSHKNIVLIFILVY